MKRILLALTVMVPLVASADEPVKCLDMTSVLWQKYHIDRGDLLQVNNACKTGVRMKAEGVSEQRFAAFVMKYITDDEDMARGLKRATEEAIVAGYDGIATE